MERRSRVGYTFDVTSVLGGLAALVSLTLGASLMAFGWRRREWFWLGFFLAQSGCANIAGAMARMASDDLDGPWLRLSILFAATSAGLLLSLAFPRPIRRALFVPTTVAAMGFLGTVATVVVLRPDVLLRDVGGAYQVTGVGRAVLIYGALQFFVALMRFYYVYLQPLSAREQHQTWLVAMAFALIPLGATTSQWADLVASPGSYFARYDGFVAPTSLASFVADFPTAQISAVTFLGVALYKRMTETSPEFLRRHNRLLQFGALVVPFAIVDWAVSQFDPRFNVTWIFRLLFAGLMIYGVLRYGALDFELRIKRNLRPGLTAALLVAVFLIVGQLAEAFAERQLSDGNQWWIAAVASGVGLFLLVPIQRLADRVARRALPDVKDSPEWRRRRGREVYEAALELAAVDGAINRNEERELARLADRLGITATQALSMRERVEARVVRSREAAGGA